LVGGRGGGSGGPGVAEFALAQHPRSVTKGAGFVPTGCFAIPHLRDFHPVGVRRNARASQMVAEQVFDGHGLGDGVFAHGDAI